MKKRKITKILISAMVIALLTLTNKNIYAAPTDVVYIPDENLKKSLNYALGRYTAEDITEEDMAKITSLDARNENISDITGIEYLVNVRSLMLSNNNITDISPISNLASYSKLTTLYLERNKISDISALNGMTTIDKLNLKYNKIQDLSPVATLKSLSYLSIGYNPISDVEQVTDIMRNITNISILDMSGIAVSEEILLLLKNKRSLMQLGLNRSSINNQDLEIIGQYSALNYLHLGGKEISDLSPLSSLNLFTLDLVGNDLSDISPLANIRNLYYLYLSTNKITDISPLANMRSLSELDLSFNQISDISPLANLTNLERLSLMFNRITDISSFGTSYPKIISLDMSNQEIHLESETIYEPTKFDLGQEIHKNSGEEINFYEEPIFDITELGSHSLMAQWYHTELINNDSAAFYFSGTIYKEVEYIEKEIENPDDGTTETPTDPDDGTDETTETPTDPDDGTDETTETPTDPNDGTDETTDIPTNSNNKNKPLPKTGSIEYSLFALVAAFILIAVKKYTTN